MEELCAAGREEPLDGLSEWILSPTLTLAQPFDESPAWKEPSVETSTCRVISALAR